MPYFDIVEKSISWDGAIRISKNNQGNIEVDTSQLQVKILTWASIGRDDASCYLGYVQIIRSNDQHNYYGSNVDQRWEYSKVPLSDSLSRAEIPWYGLDSEPKIGGYRRVHLSKPTDGPDNFNPQMNMSDDFHMTIAKFETLKDGNPGPNALNRITRSQQFQVWLVAVDENKMNNLASYKRFMQLDWIYQFDCSVSLEGEPSLVVHSENHWHNTKFGDFMDPIPPEALQAPAGNENLQLNYYLNGQFDHVVKPRQG